MALEGTLRDFSFADILQLISLQRKTGVLTLKNQDNVVTISFLEGRIVSADALNQHIEDRLGLILLKRGALSEQALEAALRKQEETLQRLGRILIDHHVVSAETIRTALEQQILQIVYRVFRWSDGEYHFSQETDVDYDRELMLPMAADSVIMEGARMTDEWPFIDQKIPDRSLIFLKVDPGRQLQVVEEAEEDFDDLGFSFADSPDEAASGEVGEDKITIAQKEVYDLVDGRLSADEVILESTLIEFETCRAIADLIDRGLIRPASNEEVARLLSEDEREASVTTSRSLTVVPWLAVPFLVLLGFSLTIMSRNPVNPAFDLGSVLWQRYVLESVSWFWMDSLSRVAETSYHLNGLYPESVADLVAEELTGDGGVVDPWGRQYRVTTRGHKLLVTGFDSSGQPVPLLIHSRSLAWEREAGPTVEHTGPGVILLEE